MYLAHASAISTTRVPTATAFDTDFATLEASGGLGHVWEYEDDPLSRDPRLARLPPRLLNRLRPRLGHGARITWLDCSDDPLQSVLEKTYRTPGDEPGLVKCTDTTRTVHFTSRATGLAVLRCTLSSDGTGVIKNLTSGMTRRLQRVARTTPWTPRQRRNEDRPEIVPPPAAPTAIAHKNAKRLASWTKEHRYVISQLQLPGMGIAAHVEQIEQLIATSELALVYQAKSAAMEARGPRNERWLWHGTSEDAAAKILRNGFNRSLCGKHGTLYGEGVYFARSPDYALRFAHPDVHGRRCLFLCSVLCGKYTKGHSALKAPPALPGGDDDELYDSVVDDVANPRMAVIFNDAQALPLYLITIDG